MDRLDRYRTALRPTPGPVTPELAAFVSAQDLAPWWHAQTGNAAFKDARMATEALYGAQRAALVEITDRLDAAAVPFVTIKGSANRELLYANPAVRICADLDLLVSHADRQRAVATLRDAGFEPRPEPDSISRELVLRRGAVDVDLHWGVLREGRLRSEPAADIVARRRRHDGLWIPSPEDTAFLLLVHPAFAKHVAGREMALHRVLDIAEWWQQYPVDQATLDEQLQTQGVRTAAWAVLEWVKLLLPEFELDTGQWQPGAVRRAWLRTWLRHDWSARLSNWHALRLLTFSPFLHDTPADAWRALKGWRQARRARAEDLAAFNLPR